MSATISPDQVRILLELALNEAESGMALAEQWGVAQSSISAVRMGRPATPKLLRAMGLRRVVRYERVDTEGR